jgi:hypothetical protein
LRRIVDEPPYTSRNAFCVNWLCRQPKCLALFGHSTLCRMMFFNDNAPGDGQNQQAAQFFHYNQSPLLPHAAASVGRATPLSLRRERTPHYLAASSRSQTAKSGRWSMMPPKRTASGSPSGTPGKTIKSEQKPEDFSNSVKKRLQSSTRTGQACDRCKVYLYFTSKSASHPKRASINTYIGP